MPLIAFLIFLGASAAYAQQSPNHLLDSLTGRLKKTLVDTSRISLLNELSYEYRHADTVKGISYGQQALDLAVKLKWLKGAIDACRNLGLNTLRNFKRSKGYFDRSLTLSERSNNKRGRQMAYYSLAWLYYTSKDNNNALRCYQIALKLSDELADLQTSAYIYGEMGDTYGSMRDTAKMLGNYQRDLAIAQKLNQKNYTANLHSLIGNIYMAKKNMPAAAANFQKSYELYMAAGDKASSSDALWNTGATYLQTNPDKALTYYEQAIAVKKELKDNFALANIYKILGDNCLNKPEKKDKAIVYYEQAISFFRHTDARAGLSDALWNLASLYWPSNTARALENYKEAFRIKEEIHNYAAVCQLAQFLGSDAVNRGDYESAIAYYRKGVNASTVLKDPAKSIDFKLSLAGTYQRRDGIARAIVYFKQAADGLSGPQAEQQRGYIDGVIGQAYYQESDYPKALSYFLSSLKIAEKIKDHRALAIAYEGLGLVYFQQRSYVKSLDYSERGLRQFREMDARAEAAQQLTNLANCYTMMKQSDKALASYQEALNISEQVHDQANCASALNNIGNLYKDMGKYADAARSVQQSLKIGQSIRYEHLIAVDMSTLAEIFIAVAKDKTKPIPVDTIFPGNRQALLAAAIKYLAPSMAYARKSGDLDLLQELLADRAQAEELQGDFPAAFADYKSHILFRDSVYSVSKNQEITRRELQYQYGKKEDSLKYQQVITQGLLNQQMLLAQQKEQQLNLLGKEKALDLLASQKTQAELRAEQEKRKANEQQLKASRKERALAQTSLQLQNIELREKKSQSYYFIAGLGALLLISLFIGLNYNNQRVANHRLSAANEQITIANTELGEKQEEIISQRDQLAEMLNELKSAQTQLIYAEKMASLGELTAGIAHEIQNPLNFVNNFSEVNVELLEELKTELQRGDLEEARAIAGDLQENERKINGHGKRADAIVKGMLEHSRASVGKKEPTDINKLADEYLRLAYHGLRAKDKSFTARTETHFEATLPLVTLVPQDFGRVLLNLLNNAFYAVQQKAKTAEPGYMPAVTLRTRAAENYVLVTVHDNGTGIPDNIRDKVMQPFFTTKPTGQGTGLGLSISYDIVTKVHGGQLTVTSAEGQFTQFELMLPL